MVSWPKTACDKKKSECPKFSRNISQCDLCYDIWALTDRPIEMQQETTQRSSWHRLYTQHHKNRVHIFSSSSSDFFKHINTTGAGAPLFFSHHGSNGRDGWRSLTTFHYRTSFACDSEGVVTAQSAHVKLDVGAKFIRVASHSVVCNKVIWLLESQSINQALKCWKLSGHLKHASVFAVKLLAQQADTRRATIKKGPKNEVKCGETKEQRSVTTQPYY